MRIFDLLIDLPFLPKGRRFWFDDDTGYVYAVLDGKMAEHPLRTALASYLWLLLTEDGYLKKVIN